MDLKLFWNQTKRDQNWIWNEQRNALNWKKIQNFVRPSKKFRPLCTTIKVIYSGKQFSNLFFFVRLQRLEESLKDEPEEKKSEKRAQHAVKETEFLRLKRSKLGVDDFDPLKVIGRGAFGEVKSNNVE